MILKQIKLLFFKNYIDQRFKFDAGINCILGKNGVGKTNILDAIHYLSMTRSALSASDQFSIRHDERYFAINAEFDSEEILKVNVYFEKGTKKTLKVDGLEPEKLSDHIGKVPCVLTTPDDNEMIKEGSEVRRKLFDSVISQFNKDYLRDLILYQRLLKQRNSFLKKNDGNLRIDRTLLDIYDGQLLPLNKRISDVRRTFLEDFQISFAENYKSIFAGEERPFISYKSDCQKPDFENLFHEALDKDIILQRTTRGCHKDDFVFKLNDEPIKQFGSQGQQKSFVIAVKLAEYDLLKAKKGFSPLLLLDDIFDKLDDERIEHLVTLLADQKRFGQIFLTDARVERSRGFFKDLPVNFIEVNEGTVV